MVALNRLRVAWGPSDVVGGGVSTFYFTGSMTGIPAAVKALYTAVVAAFPIGATWQIPSSGDTLESTTGALTGGWSTTGGGTVTATGTTTYAAGAGLRMVWETGAIFRGRRVRGATFMVPLTTSRYDAQGTILDSDLTLFSGAGNTLITAAGGAMTVWSHTKDFSATAVSGITTCTVPDKVATLRSRRV